MAQSSKKRTSSKRSQSTNKKSASGTKKRRTTKKPQQSSGIGREIVVLVCIVCAIMLFLGNIGVAGPVGSALSRLQLGLFGMAGYFFPFFFFGAALYGVAKAKDYPLYTAGRLLLLFLMLVAFCAGMELAVTGRITPEMNPSCFYKEGTAGIGGGFFGGCPVLLLLPLLGKAGSYVVLLAFLLIGIILVTGRGILFPLKDKGEKVVRAVKEESGRRSEELAAKRMERERQKELAEKERIEREKKVAKESARTRKAAGLSPSEAVIEPESVCEPEPAYEPEFICEPEPAREPEPAIKPRSRSGSKKYSPKEPVTIENSVDFGIVDARNSDKGDWRADLKLPGDSLYIPNPDEYAAQAAYEAEPEIPSFGEADTFKERSSFATPTDYEPAFAPGEVPFLEEDQPVGHLSSFEPERMSYEREQLSAYAPEPVPEQPACEPEPMPGQLPVYGSEIMPGQSGAYESEGMTGQPDTYEPEPIIRREEPFGGASGSVDEAAFTQAEPGISGPEAAFLEKMGGNPSQAPAGAVVPAQPPVVKKYEMPSINLLNRPRNSRGMQENDIRKIAVKLEKTLNDFGVRVRVTDYSCGPSVTRYELHPEQGVKVSRIVALADDIKLNLAATDIRIEAPIPGKSAVGIEVPNLENRTVFLRELLESDEYRRFPSKVAFAVGQDIAGKTIVADLARMPHLLIAGSTGSGKSVCINTLIMSILYKAKPEEVGLIMVDPKVVELSAYNGIPHLLIPVVTDPKKAAGALNWAVAEMTRRYKQFSDYNVRDIRGYNRKIEEESFSEADAPQPMKQIVIIVDELADLMMVAPGEVEESICRLAQLARAAGIHLVLATQRPSVNVITGLIKANVPSRIAFATSSGIDSRTIIDMNGAEKLLGKGDMLFYPTGYPKPVRVQGAFVSDEEVAAVTDFLKEQTSKEAVSAGAALAEQIGGVQTASERESEGPSRDELFVKAAEFIIDKEKASIGNLQRVFRIGFNRAARIMDQLSDEGIVGPEEGTKPRQILMTMQQFEQWKKDNNLV